MKTPRLLIPLLATLVATAPAKSAEDAPRGLSTRFEAGNHEVTATPVKVRGVWLIDSVK